MFTTACSTAQEQEYALRPAVIVGEAPIIPFYERLRMINVGKAFTWDLFRQRLLHGDWRQIPRRAVDHLTPNISNTVIKDFIVESSKQFFTANGIPEIPFQQYFVRKWNHPLPATH